MVSKLSVPSNPCSCFRSSAFEPANFSSNVSSDNDLSDIPAWLLFSMPRTSRRNRESWAVAVTNPYYEITDKTGAYAIEYVPPGTYRLIAWHPSIGTLEERTVTVEAKGLSRVNLSLPAPIGRRTAYEVMEPARFGQESLGRPINIDPFVERQR